MARITLYGGPKDGAEIHRETSLQTIVVIHEFGNEDARQKVNAYYKLSRDPRDNTWRGDYIYPHLMRKP
jgi:hypothetical protein